MSLAIVIPVRTPSEGKTRLADALSPRERAGLVQRMFDHVLTTALAVPAARVLVVSRDPGLLAQARARGAQPVPETGEGLNAALEQAAALVYPARPMLALSADLPLLAAADLAAMGDALQNADVVAAPDRTSTGTNALLLARPGIIPYAFGEASLTRHRASTDAAGLRFAEVALPGLATDIDLPADLALIPQRFSGARISAEA